ncbi:uncharacterized protein METZ01_LOCUS194519 [marine metagenome]|uniref:Uncharacterized protein n=1 Tax=marine metagenome TaxID=408172 RepID=A0A382DTS0_9ZZZZ
MSDWFRSTVPEDPPCASLRSCGTGTTTELACFCYRAPANLAPVSLTGLFRRVLGIYFAGRGVPPAWLGNIGNMAVLFSIVVNKPDYQFSL